MDIKTAKYKVYADGTKSVQVTDTNDLKYSVPMNNDNTDYQAILQWVADGNTIQEAD
tara:strand:- start:3548 stop:3718 length:171 start_codon:yes stop_codon:yes gene_type:complete